MADDPHMEEGGGEGEEEGEEDQDDALIQLLSALPATSVDPALLPSYEPEPLFAAHQPRQELVDEVECHFFDQRERLVPAHRWFSEAVCRCLTSVARR